MGQLRSAVRAYAAEGHGPTAVLTRASAALAEETTLLATCVVCRLDPADGTLETALAGHPPPLVRFPDSRVQPVPACPGLPLGMLAADHGYQTYESVIPPGTLVALYTDGLCPPLHVDPVAAACDILAGIGDLNDLEGAADRFVAAAGTERHDDGALLLARYDAAHGTPNRRTARTSVHRHDLRGVSMVRRTIEDTLAAWQMPDLVDEAMLLASELVTNALLHADSAVDVRLREYPDRIRIEVRDTAAAPPIPSALALTDSALAEAESGRGLIIVESLASAWGNSPSGRGKTVWFELDRMGRA
ncbi:SpoIIE family protein phosphatase [Streptomyces sp. NPDC008343]|uniref:SpoIIE family protein phosphatase n=1 Tax=Streptomyces sp. NPDC008343 TaxID=3364828 RepID=UPI0036EFB5E7